MIFTGRVEQIVNEDAYLTLKDNDGNEVYAIIEASKLIAIGIGERDRFQLEVKDDIVFTKIPRKKLDESMIIEIERKLNEALPDSLLEGAD